MNYLKKNKKKVLIIVGIVIILVLLIVCISALMPNTSRSVWGNRLDGIEEHEIKNESIDKIRSSVTGTGNASSVEYRLSGKTMNFTIKVNNDITKDKAKELTSYITSNIDNDDLTYYDIQVFFIKDDESDELFPFIGYKHKTATEFSYVGDK